LYEDQEDVLSLIMTHAQSLIWIMNIAKNHDLVDPDIAVDIIEDMRHNSKTVWEEMLWNKVKEPFLAELPSCNVHKFSPRLRGPDTE